MRTRTKICGITNLDDALLAVKLGADAVGFVFHQKSPRAVTRSVAAGISKQLPPFVTTVGGFGKAQQQEIELTLAECRLTALQFHGDESPEFCTRFAARTIKAIRVRNEDSLRAAAEYDVDALLLDTYTDESRGGTGKTFEWSLAVKAKETLTLPIILSGGLTTGNVQEAIGTVRPYAVDVASGVEREPGKKDPEKLRRFIELCRNT